MQSSPRKATAPNLSDADIVQQILAGDHGAFELLMRRYNRALYRTARSIVRDETEAEDVLQDAYLLAYRALNRFRGESSLEPVMNYFRGRAATAGIRVLGAATRRSGATARSCNTADGCQP